MYLDEFLNRSLRVTMLWVFLVTTVLLVAAVLKTRDNILASISLTFLGVVVAGAVWAFHPALSIAFILIALVYIVAALTLVIIAAASIAEDRRPTEARAIALASLAAIPLVLLPTYPIQKTPNVTLDIWLIPLLAVLLLYSFIIAARLTHD